MSYPSLINLAIEYFRRRGYKVEKDTSRGEFQSHTKKFDLLVRKGNELHPVRVKDRNRTVGVNIVINMDKASEGAVFSSPILVAGRFSEHAKVYADHHRGIKLITKSEMRRELS